MSVVRIPRPEEDAFPWLAVLGSTVMGLAIGLGLAYAGMERDRAAEASVGAGDGAGTEPVGETGSESATGAETGTEAEAQTQTEVETGTETETGTEAGTEAETGTETETGTEAGAGAETGVETGSETGPGSGSGTGPEAGSEARPGSGSGTGAGAETGGGAGSGSTTAVTLRPGRVAYLRCDGVPQQSGPFPCPRDEALETAVWAALAGVEDCARSPGPGHADIVVDFDDADAPTVRARDTFPSDTARTDDPALLACTSDALASVRTTLRPRRLVVSFRLVLDPASR